MLLLLLLLLLSRSRDEDWALEEDIIEGGAGTTSKNKDQTSKANNQRPRTQKRREAGEHTKKGVRTHRERRGGVDIWGWYERVYVRGQG